MTPASAKIDQYPYPRKRPLRYVMRRLARLALGALTQVEIIGRENIPKSGPLMVVANHFDMADVAAMVATVDEPMEFLGGFHLVDAPPGMTWIPHLWGYYEVHRGAVSRDAMHAATAVLAQKGFLMIFPEGGSWAQVLRPARPGTAYLAVRTGVPLLPVGIDGMPQIFSSLRQGQRAKVTIRVGRPFGPLHASGKGRERREQLEALGDEIMLQIAQLIPPQKRGVYAADPALREAAQAAAVYPYDNLHQTGIPPKR